MKTKNCEVKITKALNDAGINELEEKQNSITKYNRCFAHHESDQHLNVFANAHGHNSRTWFNVSPPRHD